MDQVDQAADTFSGSGCRIHCGLVLMVMIMMMVVDLALQALVLSGRFRRGPSSEACAMVSGHVGQGRLAGGVGPVLVRRKRTAAEIKQQHLRAEGRNIQRLLVAF